MENASKALIMAGGVLIGIMIISLAVYLFIDFGTTSAEINAQNAEKQLTQFNSKFTSYSDKEVTIYDVITVANYAIENNKYYEDLDDYQITVILNEKNLTDGKSYNDLIENEQTNTKKYWCKSADIQYHNNGRVKLLKFIDKN